MNPELIKATTKVSLSDDGWTLNVLSTRVATITDPKGNRKTTYFGFDSIEKAEAFKDFVETHSMVTGLCLRKAARLNTEWECKCWGVSDEFIHALVARDRLNPMPLPTPTDSTTSPQLQPAFFLNL